MTLPPKTHLLAFGGSSVWDEIPNANGTQQKRGKLKVVKVGIRGGAILEILGPFLPDSYDVWW